MMFGSSKILVAAVFATLVAGAVAPALSFAQDDDDEGFDRAACPIKIFGNYQRNENDKTVSFYFKEVEGQLRFVVDGVAYVVDGERHFSQDEQNGYVTNCVANTLEITRLTRGKQDRLVFGLHDKTSSEFYLLYYTSRGASFDLEKRFEYYEDGDIETEIAHRSSECPAFVGPYEAEFEKLEAEMTSPTSMIIDRKLKVQIDGQRRGSAKTYEVAACSKGKIEYRRFENGNLKQMLRYSKDDEYVRLMKFSPLEGLSYFLMTSKKK